MKKLTCISLLSLCLAACVPRSDQQPPSTQHYSFESPRTTTKTPLHSLSNVISISPASIHSTFAGKSFVYKKGGYEYWHDPYRQFTASPNMLITHFIQTDLCQQSTTIIIDSDSLLKPNYILQLSIEALYADYEDKAAPQAVTAIDATLFHIKEGDAIPIANEFFSQSLPIKPNDPNDLMRAYSENLSLIDKKISTLIAEHIASE